MIDNLLSDVEKAFQAEAYFAALSLLLMLPDICGKAEYPEKGNKDRYIAWYDKYIGQYEKRQPFTSDVVSKEKLDEYNEKMKDVYLSGEIIYKLRCNMLHQGTPNIKEDEKEKKKKAEKKDKNVPINFFQIFIDEENEFDIYADAAGLRMDNDGKTTSQYRLNIRRLYGLICCAVKDYYSNNKEKFNFFDYEIIRYGDIKKFCGRTS